MNVVAALPLPHRLAALAVAMGSALLLLPVPQGHAASRTSILAELETRTPRAPRLSDAIRLSPEEERRINQQLYTRMMKQAREARDPAIINAYLDLARRLFNNQLGPSTEQQDLQGRVGFYENLLATAPKDEIKDDFYYELSSSYDRLGQTDQAARTLETLLQRFPDSASRQEAQFRLAEYAFARKDYATARRYYQQSAQNAASLPLAQQADAPYWQQAQYQLGWGYYKDGQFEQAISAFEQLIHALQNKPALNKGEQSRLQDSVRTLSLAYVQLGGAPALAKRYADQPLSPNELQVYREVIARYREQKQEFDVAQTYESFIKRHPKARETAQFNAELIDVYKGAGFAQDIIRSKTDYVQRFATGGQYFQQADAADQASLRPVLKANLDDLARHFHALAQKDQSPEEYRKAAELYRQQLELASTPDDQVRIRQSLAEVLYSAGDYEQAIPLFESLAYQPPLGQKPHEAGYFALLSYQAQLKKLSAAQQGTWLAQQLDSSLRFADAFPRDAQTPTILLTLAGQYLDRQQSVTVQQLSERTLQLPQLAAADRKTALILRANSLFDQQNWTQAETAYADVLKLTLDADDRQRYQNQLAISLYRQAESQQQSKSLEASSRLYQRASDQSADDRLKVDAAWRSAMVLGEVPAAIVPLQGFLQRYGDREQAKGLLERIAAIQTGAQDWSGLSRTYQQIAQRDRQTAPDNAAAALWLAADSERRVINAPEQDRHSPLSASERSLYQQYLGLSMAPLEQQVEASERLYQDALLRQDGPAQQQELARQSRWATEANVPASLQPRMRYLLARVRHLEALPVLSRYQALNISQPLKPSIAAKQAALDEVIRTQQAILDLKVADFVPQAQATLGDSFAQFYQAILAITPPDSLDDLAKEQFTLALEEQADPLKSKAIEWHQANIRLAQAQPPLWDRWIGQSFASLARLSPGRYQRPVRPAALGSSDAALARAATLVKDGLPEQALPLIEASLTRLAPPAAPQTPPKSTPKSRAPATVTAAATPTAQADLYASALLLHAQALIGTGQFQGAEKQLLQLISLQPDQPEGPYQLGILYELYLNQPSAALSQYQRYTVLRPDDKLPGKWLTLLAKQTGTTLPTPATALPVPPTTVPEVQP